MNKYLGRTIFSTLEVGEIIQIPHKPFAEINKAFNIDNKKVYEVQVIQSDCTCEDEEHIYYDDESDCVFVCKVIKELSISELKEYFFESYKNNKVSIYDLKNFIATFTKYRNEAAELISDANDACIFVNDFPEFHDKFIQSILNADTYNIIQWCYQFPNDRTLFYTEKSLKNNFYLASSLITRFYEDVEIIKSFYLSDVKYYDDNYKNITNYINRYKN